MHTEDDLLPADEPRRGPAGNGFAQTAQPEDTFGLPALKEAWSAFTPASERPEDILLIPEEPLEAVEAVVQAQVLEDVFGNDSADSDASVEAETALSVEAYKDILNTLDGDGLGASAVEPDAIHTSLAQYEEAASEPALPSVEDSRGAAPTYDKYAVGMRILRISPVWLLLSTFGFISVILLFSWMSRPTGKVEAAALEPALKNEATNQSQAHAAQPSAPEVAVAAPAVEQPAPAPSAEATTTKEEPSKEPEQPQQTQAPVVQEPARPSEAVAGEGNFTVQVGSFPDASQANERVSALRAAGVEARAAGVEIPKRGTWYRVQAGRFQTREEATRFGAQLRARGAAESVIVTEVEKH